MMLNEFITNNRGEIISRCRAKAAPLPPGGDVDTLHGVPEFLDQLVDALRRGERSSPEIGATAMMHGHELLRRGFTVSQVVHAYGDVCQSITDLAVETNANISASDFRTLNGCLDDAIASAVTQFDREQTTADANGVGSNERLGFLAHELRNLLQTAIYAFEVVKSGNVGVAGSTGTVLHRSLVSARDLIARSLAELRLAHGIENRERFRVADFLADLTEAATLEATRRGVRFILMAAERGSGADAMIDADRQVLTAVVNNLLQNAFKFTHPGTTVVLRAGGGAERVLIEVQDECGGLPSGDHSALFRPFEQRAADRTGSGLGLAFCRSAIEGSGGRIYARSLPDVGCIFTVDLPRSPASAHSAPAI